MKKQINRALVFVSVLSVLVSVFSVTIIYYEIFKKQVIKDLEFEAGILSQVNLAEVTETEIPDEVRVTWISQSGKVLFDNGAEITTLPNHLDRPEIIEALQKGQGSSTRHSDTLGMRTVYYACQLKDGTIIRVAKDVHSIFSVLLSPFILIAVMMVLIISICIYLGKKLTTQLLAPIEKISEDLNHISTIGMYDEFQPFIQRIKDQHEEILSAAQSRQDFTANVSHELKTPLTAISGYAELIENQMVDNEQEIRFAKEIRKNANHLVNQINDIIRLSQLDQDKFSENFDLVDVYDVVSQRMSDYRTTAYEKNIQVNLMGESCEVLSDCNLLIELFDNLVSNAIRYNRVNGYVNISVYKKENTVEITVEDNGIGIPEEDQKHVFERFYRVDKSRSSQTGGTGLGLSIVKHIVELHHGTIFLQSEEGKNTTITIQL